jgi:hypothetical protein
VLFIKKLSRSKCDRFGGLTCQCWFMEAYVTCSPDGRKLKHPQSIINLTYNFSGTFLDSRILSAFLLRCYRDCPHIYMHTFGDEYFVLHSKTRLPTFAMGLAHTCALINGSMLN